MHSPLSYIITSFAPEYIDTAFKDAKKGFGFYLQHDIGSNQIVTKNHAHITLLRSSHFTEGVEEEQVSRVLQEVTMAPFEVLAERVDVFRTEKHGNVIVLLVAKSPELLFFHNALQSAAGPFFSKNAIYEQYGFNPHLSVFYNVLEEDLDRLVRYTEQHFLPMRYVMDGFVLLKEVAGKKGVREVVKEYSFAKNS